MFPYTLNVMVIPVESTVSGWVGDEMWFVAPLLPKDHSATQSDLSSPLVASTPRMQRYLTHPAQSAG